MGAMKTVWQEERQEVIDEQYSIIKTHHIINDPFNLWDDDGHEAQAIDLNNWADMAE
jgi:hypothetical protein